ncbi:hypothetical protein FQZ97_672210 [compost metagenome]
MPFRQRGWNMRRWPSGSRSISVRLRCHSTTSVARSACSRSIMNASLPSGLSEAWTGWYCRRHWSRNWDRQSIPAVPSFSMVRRATVRLALLSGPPSFSSRRSGCPTPSRWVASSSVSMTRRRIRPCESRQLNRIRRPINGGWNAGGRSSRPVANSPSSCLT